MHKQIIYYGAPGTGKSYLVEESLKIYDQSQIYRVTMHPEYSYSDFIGQILPVKDNKSNQISFEFCPGPFTRALQTAFSDSSKEVILVIEELSRGNIASIFGDIFQLLDRSKFFISRYKIRNKNIANVIPELTSDIIYLPSNFSIIGTLNTSDQNVFSIDNAFKRRFSWKYISTKPHKNKFDVVDLKNNNPLLTINDSTGTFTISWLAFYTSLNKLITDKKDGMGKREDKQIGQFFCKFEEKDIEDSNSSVLEIKERGKNSINSIIKDKLLLYLWQDIEDLNSFNSGVRIFDEAIVSFEELYERFSEDKIFSDIFINNFLKKNSKLYKYSE
jgi:hypothetical protein